MHKKQSNAPIQYNAPIYLITIVLFTQWHCVMIDYVILNTKCEVEPSTEITNQCQILHICKYTVH